MNNWCKQQLLFFLKGKNSIVSNMIGLLKNVSKEL